jgi:hypothetical protein
MEVYQLSILLQKQYNKLSEEAKTEFNREFNRRQKSTVTAYFLYILFGWHYAYLKSWGMLFMYLLSFGGFGLWLLADLFRIPSLIRSYNEKTAIDIMSEIKTLDQ